ncbi:MAG: LysM peptidoglycan-binding domain-containing protein, partial [Chlamydiota bacterium]
FALQQRESSFVVSLPGSSNLKQEEGNGQLIQSMSNLSFRELVSFLTNRDLVEEGYTKRDLALAALVAFCDFNLEKALSAAPDQRRILSFSENQKIEIFPGLNDEQFQAIIRYAYQEKWPLTAKGLFSLLQKWKMPREESLETAFLMTPEFYSLQVLFQKTEAPQDAPMLLKLVCEGNWDLLERFSREQSQMLDLSVEKRRRLLLSYLSLHSPTAANLLLRTDYLFALKKLDDQGILDLLGLLQQKTEESERFCIELLRSPRNDLIWQRSAQCLYVYAKETPPNPLDPKLALARFAPNAAPVPIPAPTSVVAAALPKPSVLPPQIRNHVVKEGESLWKIARQHKVKVDELVKVNGLEKDCLQPGMTLRIPTHTQGTGSEPPR